jgi:CRISPR-associated exonuclease Cas4
MAFSDDELLPISALQHLVFCERQCALIHVDGVWQENRLTAEGRELHHNVDEPGHQTRRGVRVVRAVRLQSYCLGLTGIADVVEFHAPKGAVAAGMSIGDWRRDPKTLKGWRVVPVEYKRGRPKAIQCDDVQLCAQAFCLEEMLGIQVSEGRLFYGQEKSRTNVVFSQELRERTVEACSRLRQVIASEILPPPVYDKRCHQCSLVDECMPTVVGSRQSVGRFVERAVSAALNDEETELGGGT